MRSKQKVRIIQSLQIENVLRLEMNLSNNSETIPFWPSTQEVMAIFRITPLNKNKKSRSCSEFEEKKLTNYKFCEIRCSCAIADLY